MVTGNGAEKNETAKSRKINVQGNEIVIYKHESDDYISLTDIARYKDPEHIDVIIQNWLRNRNTVELLGFWKIINNPDFKPLNLESINALLIKQGLSQRERLIQLNKTAIAQMKTLVENRAIKIEVEGRHRF